MVLSWSSKGTRSFELLTSQGLNSHRITTLSSFPIRFKSWLQILILFVGGTWCVATFAAIPAISVSTPKDTPLEINFSQVVDSSGISGAALQIVSPPTKGTYTVGCSSTNNCIVYTPNSAFSGFDNFQYTIDASETPQTVTINVGSVSANNSGSNAVFNTLVTICDPSATTDLDLFCSAFRAASATPGEIPPDLRELLNAISPQDVAAQGGVNSDFINQQLSNITKHLSALRQAQTSVSLGGLTLRQDDKSITGTTLAQWLEPKPESDKITDSHLPDLGGGASADNLSKGQMSYFGNGTIVSASQKETEFENAFEVSTNGITQGIDYRLGSSGYIGLAGGYANSDVTMDYSQGGLKAEGFNFILYGTFYLAKSAYLDLILTSGNTHFDNERKIVFGTENTLATSGNDSSSLGTKATLGYSLANIKGWSGNMEFSAQQIKTTIDGFSEVSESLYSVTVEDRNQTRTTLSLGGNITYAASYPGMVVMPQFDLFAIHNLETDGDEITAYFNEDPNHTRFSFLSNTPDSNYIQSNLGVSFISPGGFTGYLQLGATLSNEFYSGTQFSAGLRVEFGN